MKDDLVWNDGHIKNSKKIQIIFPFSWKVRRSIKTDSKTRIYSRPLDLYNHNLHRVYRKFTVIRHLLLNGLVFVTSLSAQSIVCPHSPGFRSFIVTSNVSLYDDVSQCFIKLVLLSFKWPQNSHIVRDSRYFCVDCIYCMNQNGPVIAGWTHVVTYNSTIARTHRSCTLIPDRRYSDTHPTSSLMQILALLIFRVQLTHVDGRAQSRNIHYGLVVSTLSVTEQVNSVLD